MNTERQPHRHTAQSLVQSEVRRRLARASAALQQARCELHQTYQAVVDAEVALMARRIEREAAVLRVAELAEIVETLQRELERGDEVTEARDKSATRAANGEPTLELAGTA